MFVWFYRDIWAAWSLGHIQTLHLSASHGSLWCTDWSHEPPYPPSDRREAEYSADYPRRRKCMTCRNALVSSILFVKFHIFYQTSKLRQHHLITVNSNWKILSTVYFNVFFVHNLKTISSFHRVTWKLHSLHSKRNSFILMMNKLLKNSTNFRISWKMSLWQRNRPKPTRENGEAHSLCTLIIIMQSE